MRLLFRCIALLPVSRLTKIEVRKQLINRASDKQIAEARRNRKPAAAIEELRHYRRTELDIEDESADAIITAKLLAQARHLRVPMPPHMTEDGTETEMWDRTPCYGKLVLTAAGIAQIREESRKEQRWRAEHRAHYIAWLAALTGLI